MIFTLSLSSVSKSKYGSYFFAAMLAISLPSSFHLRGSLRCKEMHRLEHDFSLRIHPSPFLNLYLKHTLIHALMNSWTGTKKEGRRWEVVTRTLLLIKGHKRGSKVGRHPIQHLSNQPSKVCVCVWDSFGESLYPNTAPQEALGNAGGLEGG